MYISETAKKVVFPIYIVWIALTSTFFLYGGLLIYLDSVTNIVIKNDLSSLINVLQPLRYLPFIFTFVFHKKLSRLVREGNMVKSPHIDHLTSEDRKILSQFSSYFIIHIIFYAANEFGVILGFVLAKATNDLTYYFYPAAVALFLNVVIMRPRYFEFIKGKNFE